MTEKLTDEQIKQLTDRYFLIGRQSFWGGLVGILVAVGLISFGASRTAIETWAQSDTLNRLNQADAIANRLINEVGLLPDGAIVMVSKDTQCPSASTELTQFNIQTYRRDTELHRATFEVALSNSSWDVNAENWDGLTFRTCLF